MQYLDHLFTLLHYALFTFGCWFLAEPHALFRPLLVSSARCWFLAEPHPLLRSWCWFLAEPHPLLRSVLVPSGTAPPTPPSHPPLPRCWFLAEPHLSPLPGASIHSFCGFQIQKIPCAPVNSLSILPLLVELIILFYASVCHMCTIRMCTSELTL